MAQNILDGAALDGPGDRRAVKRLALWIAAAALLAHMGLGAGGVWSFEELNYDDPQVLAAVEDSSIGDLLTGLTYFAYKPVYFLSLKIDSVFGSATVAVAHIVNWLLHALAVFLLVRLLFDLFGSRWIAGAAGLLFAVHPVHVENVAWLSERKDVLSLVFVLWAHLVYRRQRRGEGTLLWLPALLLLLGGLTKGTVWSYAGVIAVDQLLHARAHARRVWTLPLLLVCAVGVGGVVLDGLVAARSGVSAIEHGVSTLSLTAAMAGVHARYLFNLLAPFSLALDYAVEPGGSWGSPLSWIGLLLAIAAVVLLVRGVKRGRTLLALAAAFWIFGLAPVNNVWPRTTALMADRYLYMPAIGLYLLIAFGLARAGRWRTPVLGAAALLLLVLCTVRTGVFRDSERVWSDTIDKVPESALAHIQRGVATATASRFVPALADADEALSLEARPELHVRARLLRCAALYGLGRFEELREEANAAATAAKALEEHALVREDSRKMQSQAQIFRGQALEQFDERHAALDAYKRAEELDPESWSALFNLGTLLAVSRNEDKLNEAIDYLRRAQDRAPGRLDVALQLATVYGRRGNKKGAMATLKRAEARHGRAPDLLYTRATIQLELGNQWAKARDILRELREVDPKHPKGKRLEADIELAIGRAALEKGRTERTSKLLRRAVDHFDEALRILPKHWQAHVFAGDSFGEQGRYGEARNRYREARKIAPRERWIAGLMARMASLESALDARRAETREDVARAARIMAAGVGLDVARIDLGFAPLQEELPLLREVAAVLEKDQLPEADYAASILCVAALLVTGDEMTALTNLRGVFGHLGGSERSAALLDAALVLRAMLYERQTDFGHARADFELLAKRRPDDLLPPLRLLQIDLRVKEAHRLTATGFADDSARVAEATRAAQESAVRAQTFADAHPTSSAAGLLAVQADINLERWIEALRRLNDMVERFPDNPTVYRGFNAVYVAWYTKTRDQGHIREADRQLRKAMDLDPRDARTLMDASQLARVAGNLQSAMKNAQSARDMESYAGGPASRMLCDLQIELGKQALQGGQVEAVKQAIQAARKVAPNRAGSWVLEGELALKSPGNNRVVRAYELAVRAKELEPYDPDVNSLLARCHGVMATVAQFHMGRYQVPRKGTKARAEFDELPAEEQDRRRAAYAKRREEYRLRAIEDLNMALLLDPGAEGAEEMGRQVKRLEEASSTTQFDRRQMAQTHYEEGRRHEAAGERVDALYAYAKAVQLHHGFARAHFALLKAGSYLLSLLSRDEAEERKTAEKYLEMAHRALIALETLDVNHKFAGLWYYRGRLNEWDWRHKEPGHPEAKEVARLAAVAAFEHFVLTSRADGQEPETSQPLRDALARLKVLRGEK